MKKKDLRTLQPMSASFNPMKLLLRRLNTSKKMMSVNWDTNLLRRTKQKLIWTLHWMIHIGSLEMLCTTQLNAKTATTLIIQMRPQFSYRIIWNCFTAIYRLDNLLMIWSRVGRELSDSNTNHSSRLSAITTLCKLWFIFLHKVWEKHAPRWQWKEQIMSWPSVKPVMQSEFTSPLSPVSSLSPTVPSNLRQRQWTMPKLLEMCSWL